MHHYKLLIVMGLLLVACGQRLTAPAIESIDPTLPAPAVATTAPSADSPPASLSPTLAPEPTVAPEVQPTQPPAPTDTPAPVGLAFVNMEVPVTGLAVLETGASSLRFSPDFTVSPGPDLYVILSGANNLALDFHAFSRTVLDAPILYLGALANTSGEQTYLIPAGTGLAQFNTVVVWCKTYSVAFAAAPLR